MVELFTVRNEVAKVMFYRCLSVHWEGLLPGRVPGPGGGGSGRMGAWSWGGLRGGLVSQHALTQTPPGEMATAADGTHPTGMHSCSLKVPSSPLKNLGSGHRQSSFLLELDQVCQISMRGFT